MIFAETRNVGFSCSSNKVGRSRDWEERRLCGGREPLGGSVVGAEELRVVLICDVRPDSRIWEDILKLGVCESRLKSNICEGMR